MRSPAFMRKFVPADTWKRRLQFAGISLFYGIAVCWAAMLLVHDLHYIERLPYAIWLAALLILMPMGLDSAVQKRLRQDEPLRYARSAWTARKEQILAEYYEAAAPGIDAYFRATRTSDNEQARIADSSFEYRTAPLVSRRDEALAANNEFESKAYDWYKITVRMHWLLRAPVWLLGAALAYELAPLVVKYVVPLLQMH